MRQFEKTLADIIALGHRTTALADRIMFARGAQIREQVNVLTQASKEVCEIKEELARLEPAAERVISGASLQ